MTRARCPRTTHRNGAASSTLLRLDLVPGVQVQETDLPAAVSAYKHVIVNDIHRHLLGKGLGVAEQDRAIRDMRKILTHEDN